ncbi:hypothetical protein DYH10_04350 [Candidatus Saccharibacteria bacterium CPR2]|nr:hypothetical protein [Candidatus Saccharibacteria bacterium CPR2]
MSEQLEQNNPQDAVMKSSFSTPSGENRHESKTKTTEQIGRITDKLTDRAGRVGMLIGSPSEKHNGMRVEKSLPSGKQVYGVENVGITGVGEEKLGVYLHKSRHDENASQRIDVRTNEAIPDRSGGGYQNSEGEFFNLDNKEVRSAAADIIGKVRSEIAKKEENNKNRRRELVDKFIKS